MMRQTINAALVSFVIAVSIDSSSAFAPNGGIASSPLTSLSMVAKYDKTSEKWFTTDPETEGDGTSYGPVGSLYRAGPKPFLTRITNPETYDQGVLKYMAQAGCDRKEAQGNMDAFIENPQDWGYQKMSEKNGAYVKDYANANMAPKQIALSSIWAFVVIIFVGNLINSGINNGLMSDSFQRTMDILSGEPIMVGEPLF